MAENETAKETTEEQEAQPQAEGPQTTIRWESGKMQTSYANICNISSTREEVTLLFGTNQNWHAGQQELTIELANRILLSPYTAKKMALLLNHTVKEYENRFGELVFDN